MLGLKPTVSEEIKEKIIIIHIYITGTVSEDTTMHKPACCYLSEPPEETVSDKEYKVITKGRYLRYPTNWSNSSE